MSNATTDKGTEIDWGKILNFLEPKHPLYCPEEMSLTQKAFLRVNAKEAFFGGAAGGGKSSALLMAALQYVDVPDYAAILFRKTYKDLSLQGSLMDRAFNWMSEFPEVHVNRNDYIITFPSGARIAFGYLAGPDDHLRYQGAEFQFVGMDEVTHIREHQYRYLMSRLRRPKVGPLAQVPLRMRSASNPEANWVRQYFIVEGKEKGRIFIPSRLEDNPGLDIESYREMLATLDPVTRQRLEFGDWWTTESGSMFKREDFMRVETSDIPQALSPKRLVRYWDLAGTAVSETNKDPDWTVGVLGMFQEGVFYVLNVERCRENPKGVQDFVAKVAQKDGKNIPIRMEQEPASSGKAVIDNYARYVLPGYDFKGIRSTGDKITRARPMSAAAANGNVCVVESSKWLNDFLDEITAFPESYTHDDQVDAVTGAFNYLAGLGLPQRKPLEIIV